MTRRFRGKTCCCCGADAVLREESERFWCQRCSFRDLPENKARHEAETRLSRIRLIAQGASAKEDAAVLFSRLLAISLEADGVTSESGRFL